MMTCRRGDGVLVVYPDSNLRTCKRRPGLGVQADNIGTDLAQTIVAMITSNMSRAECGSRVIVLAGSENAKRAGLLQDSVIMTDNLATLHFSEIGRVIGNFAEMAAVDSALGLTLGL